MKPQLIALLLFTIHANLSTAAPLQRGYRSQPGGITNTTPPDLLPPADGGCPIPPDLPPADGGCPISPTDTASYCAGTHYNASQTNTYICGDWRLGPVRLPRMIPLDSVIEFYHRFGPLCPGQFIDRYWDADLKPDPYWRFPSQDGFSLNTDGSPIKGKYTLKKGVLVDRFGGEGGRFVSPAAAPYTQRALPPNNLDQPQGSPVVPYNYHLYRVDKDVEVFAGPIAPFFEQPGQGVQYQLLPAGIRTVADLIADKTLIAEDALELYGL